MKKINRNGAKNAKGSNAGALEPGENLDTEMQRVPTLGHWNQGKI